MTASAHTRAERASAAADAASDRARDQEYRYELPAETARELARLHQIALEAWRVAQPSRFDHNGTFQQLHHLEAVKRYTALAAYAESPTVETNVVCPHCQGERYVHSREHGGLIDCPTCIFTPGVVQRRVARTSLRGAYAEPREGVFTAPMQGLGDGEPAKQPRARRGANSEHRACLETPEGSASMVEICATWRGKPLPKITSSRDIRDRVAHFVRADGMVREFLGVMPMTSKLQPIGFYIAALGTTGGAMSDAQTVMRPVLLTPAAAFVIVHNHPSGVTQPSSDDVAFTSRVIAAGKLMGVSMVDHIILGRNGEYFSFLDAGLLGG